VAVERAVDAREAQVRHLVELLQRTEDREPHLVARMPDHELWIAFFKDPEGNTLALMSEVRGS